MIFQKFTYEALDYVVNKIEPFNEQNREIIREQLLQPGLEPESNCFFANDEHTDELMACVLMSREDLIHRVVLDFWFVKDLTSDKSNVTKRQILELMIQRCLDQLVDDKGFVVHCCLHDLNYSSVFEDLGFELNRTYWKMNRSSSILTDLELQKGFYVKDASKDSVETLTALQNDSFTGSWGFCPNTSDQIEYKLLGSHTGYKNVIFLCNEMDTVGYCWTYIYQDGDRLTGAISMIGVSSNYRGKGISRGLLNHGLDKLQSMGCDSVFLEVDSNNIPAISIYKSSGFEKTEEMYWYELLIKD